MKRPVTRTFCALAVLSVTVAACSSSGKVTLGSTGAGGASAGPSSGKLSFAQIEALGEKEGKLVLYSSSHDVEDDAIIKAFNEKYPQIKVIRTELVANDLESRFAAERKAGSATADVINLTDTAIFENDSSWFTKITTGNVPNLANVEPKFVGSNYAVTATSQFVLTYNTDKIKKPPATWKDLTDPSLHGQGLLADPRAAPGFLGVYIQLDKLYGDAWLKQFAANGWKLYTDSSTAVQQVAAGAAAIAGPGHVSHSADVRAAGAPVAVDYIKPELTTEQATGINATAADPYAALLYLNFMLTSQAMTIACEQLNESPLIKPPAKCQGVPANAVIATDPAVIAKNGPAVLKLMGIQ